jgi:hypothetical protein
MNLQQQREEARRRRLVNRSLIQHRKQYFDDVRRSLVVGNLTMLPAADMRPQDPTVIDSPAITRTLKLGIVMVMAAVLLQNAVPLLKAAASLLPSGLIG